MKDWWDWDMFWEGIGLGIACSLTGLMVGLVLARSVLMWLGRP